jgi:hypothetical protein
MHMTSKKWSLTAILFGLLLSGSGAVGEDFSPYTKNPIPRQVFFGDTHLHSNLSFDAVGFGVTLGPDAAFRFASGEQVVASNGQPAQLSRPLDFVVLSDHAESLGVMKLVTEGDPRVMMNDTLVEWNRLLNGTAKEAAQFRGSFFTRKGRKAIGATLHSVGSEELSLDIWGEALAIAEHYNRPGSFTTLLGYEWTSAPGGSNLHRVVLFRDDIEKVAAMRPFTATESDDPVDLWHYLARYESATGGRTLAIPHNGNLSNGLLYPFTQRLRGGVVDEEYARQRARWEPVMEVTQIKGDGETHPLLSPDDEFADYETWDRGNMSGVPKKPEMLPQEYARSSLRNGLQLAQTLGVNPYQLGLIGSTDSHTALAAVREDNFFGKHSGVEPDAKRWNHIVGKAADQVVKGWQQAASGYAAVWATENTRVSLFDAIKRREVYATTGSRMTVRLFGGWQYRAEHALAPDMAALGYAKGVPMGGVLSAPAGTAPSFLVSASKDSIGANLDRIQMVKGWLDGDGQTHEQVYNITWSGQRQLDKNGKLPEVGNTVDVAAAQYDNSIGAVQLSTVWKDPNFNPEQRAFYYVRVIEIPTPRWTAYDAKRFAISMAAEVPMITQERAYTSPIWYEPETTASGK